MDYDIYLIEQFFGEPMPCDKHSNLFLGSYYLRETLNSKFVSACYSYRSKFFPVFEYDKKEFPFGITLDSKFVLGQNIRLKKKETRDLEEINTFVYDPNNIEPIQGVSVEKPKFAFDLSTPISNGTELFIPSKVISHKEEMILIEGTIAGQVYVAKIQTPNNIALLNTKKYASYEVRDDFKVEGSRNTVIIMEKLAPISLDDNAYQIAIDIIREIKSLHRSGKMHYDIKPDNIMRKSDGSYVLIDFDNIVDDVDERKEDNRRVPFTGEIIEGHKYRIIARNSWTPLFAGLSGRISSSEYFLGLYTESPVFDLIELGYSLNYLTGNENSRSKAADSCVHDYLNFVCSLPLSILPIGDEVYDRCIDFFM